MKRVHNIQWEVSPKISLSQIKKNVHKITVGSLYTVIFVTNEKYTQCMIGSLSKDIFVKKKEEKKCITCKLPSFSRDIFVTNENCVQNTVGIL